jgi:hypothetical protein
MSAAAMMTAGPTVVRFGATTRMMLASGSTP